MAHMLQKNGARNNSKDRGKEILPFWQIQHNNLGVEWIRLASNKIILATEERVWVYRSNFQDSKDFLARPSKNSSSVATTKNILDTAIVLGKRAADSSQKPHALTPATWIWSLASQYHLTHSTPQLMKEASRRFSVRGRELLAEWAAQKAIEETGHDRLALLDIQSLGYEAEAVVETFVSPSTTALLDYFISSVQTSDPIGCVGYSYTLERVALIISEKHIQAVKARMPLGTNATRCLRVHSSIGSDTEHVEEIIELVAELTLEERTQVALACYETAKIYFSSYENDYPSEEELQQKLTTLKCNTL